jgi:hypothetical protein
MDRLAEVMREFGFAKPTKRDQNVVEYSIKSTGSVVSSVTLYLSKLSVYLTGLGEVDIDGLSTKLRQLGWTTDRKISGVDLTDQRRWHLAQIRPRVDRLRQDGWSVRLNGYSGSATKEEAEIRWTSRMNGLLMVGSKACGKHVGALLDLGRAEELLRVSRALRGHLDVLDEFRSRPITSMVYALETAGHTTVNATLKLFAMPLLITTRAWSVDIIADPPETLRRLLLGIGCVPKG